MSFVLTKFLAIMNAGIIFCSEILAETVEVPPDAENFYSEEAPNAGFEPEITIIKKKNSIQEEYRLNGKLYMVKIIPAAGPPYFYIDNDGDGVWDTRANGRNSSPQVPKWVIFSW